MSGLSAVEMAGVIGFAAFVCFIGAVAPGPVWQRVLCFIGGVCLIVLAVWVYIVFERWADANKEPV